MKPFLLSLCLGVLLASCGPANETATADTVDTVQSDQFAHQVNSDAAMFTIEARETVQVITESDTSECFFIVMEELEGCGSCYGTEQVWQKAEDCGQLTDDEWGDFKAAYVNKREKLYCG